MKVNCFVVEPDICVKQKKIVPALGKHPLQWIVELLILFFLSSLFLPTPFCPATSKLLCLCSKHGSPLGTECWKRVQICTAAYLRIARMRERVLWTKLPVDFPSTCTCVQSIRSSPRARSAPGFCLQRLGRQTQAPGTLFSGGNVSCQILSPEIHLAPALSTWHFKEKASYLSCFCK